MVGKFAALFSLSSLQSSMRNMFNEQEKSGSKTLRRIELHLEAISPV
jgi:hypothetical protein